MFKAKKEIQIMLAETLKNATQDLLKPEAQSSMKRHMRKSIIYEDKNDSAGLH